MESKTVYEIKTENGKTAKVELCITQREGREKPYGIYAVISDGITRDEAYANERFFTHAEAEAAVRMLCRGEVTLYVILFNSSRRFLISGGIFL